MKVEPTCLRMTKQVNGHRRCNVSCFYHILSDWEGKVGGAWGPIQDVVCNKYRKAIREYVQCESSKNRLAGDKRLTGAV
jgi:hypothetical protein